MRGQLITIEGLDGAGKTTLADALVARCAVRRRDVVLLREPGGRRALRAHPRARQGPGAGGRPARRGAALRGGARPARGRARRAAARGGHVGAARPLRRLLAGLPGRGRGLGVEAVRASTTSPPAACAPTARCCCAPTRPRARRARPCRGEAPDRLEREDDAFFDAIAGAYDALAAAEPERFRVLDAGAEPRVRARAGGAGRSGLSGVRAHGRRAPLASVAVLGRRGAIALTCAAALVMPAAAHANAFDDALKEYRTTGAVDGCKHTAGGACAGQGADAQGHRADRARLPGAARRRRCEARQGLRQGRGEDQQHGDRRDPAGDHDDRPRAPPSRRRPRRRPRRARRSRRADARRRRPPAAPAPAPAPATATTSAAADDGAPVALVVVGALSSCCCSCCGR